MPKQIIEINPSRHVLGNICKYGHQWEQTGKSLRYLHNGLCVICKRNSHSRQVENSSEYRERKRNLNLISNRKRLSNPESKLKAIKASNNYKKKKLEEDEYYKLVYKIRNQFRQGIKRCEMGSKKGFNKKYEISYAEILNHIGPCPGLRSDFHIDHIVPLASFDLRNDEEVKKAFSPKNHQWLSAFENISKNAGEFSSYMKKEKLRN